MMFETGHPNAGVVTDWAKNGARLFSNSMMTAVYELLPNSTDLTVHIERGYNGVNMAISDGLDFYHTAKDDLAHLDRASVQHMGDQALGATRAFLAGDWAIDKNPNAEMAYSDVVLARLRRPAADDREHAARRLLRPCGHAVHAAGEGRQLEEAGLPRAGPAAGGHRRVGR